MHSDMQPTIKLTKFVDRNLQDSYRRSWALKIVAVGNGIGSEVFVYQKGGERLDPDPTDSFSCVASPTLMDELGTDRAKAEPYYRRDTLELICATAGETEEIWAEIQRQLTVLVRDYGCQQNLLVSETASIGPIGYVDVHSGMPEPFYADRPIYFIGPGQLYYQLQIVPGSNGSRTVSVSQTGLGRADIMSGPVMPIMIDRPFYMKGQDGLYYLVQILDVSGTKTVDIGQSGLTLDQLDPILLNLPMYMLAQDSLYYSIAVGNQAGTITLNVSQEGQ